MSNDFSGRGEEIEIVIAFEEIVIARMTIVSGIIY
jgi:hypothetical protein